MKDITRTTSNIEYPTGAESRMPSYEELTRLRCQQLREEAESQRLARRLTAGRWWRWLSCYAARRAERVTWT